MNSDLHVYSVGCSWHGHISKVGKTLDTVPCCPHCGSVLCQIDSKEWWDGARKAERDGRTNYVAFLRWTESCGRCFSNNSEAASNYNESPESFRQKYNHIPFNTLKPQTQSLTSLAGEAGWSDKLRGITADLRRLRKHPRLGSTPWRSLSLGRKSK